MGGRWVGWYYSGLRLVSVQLALDCQLELSLAIDLISTMTLGHILRARSSGAELSPPGLLISIKRHLRTIMGKMPKYKNVIEPILVSEIDPG